MSPEDTNNQVTQTSLMNALPVGIGVLSKGADGFEFQNANVRLRNMLGITEQVSLNQLLGEKAGKMVNDLSKTVGGETVIEHNGNWFAFNITSFQGGEWLAVVSDVTNIKSKVQAAENLTEMKGRFLAMMSHEIRTPMQSIFGLLELISDEDNLTEDAVSMLGTAKTSATGLLAILDDILDIAKVDAGKMDLDILEVPVRTLAYGVIECMEVKKQGHKVKLVTEINKDVPAVITGDPTRLRQILLNLVGNAMKFTDKGEIRLKITSDTHHLNIKGSELGLRFEVIDTGIGMPKNVADKLFQDFTQADSSTTRKYGGTGLGLSICKKLVDLMGGEIGVISVPGDGSNFWFEIPTEPVTGEKPQQLPDLNGIAVLSVEDHPQGAKEIERTLKSMGADVTSVPSYAEGLSMIHNRRYDVALIDQGLPDGLGIDLLKEISKAQPYTGMIMYTVRDDYGLQHTTRTLGAKYLSKPASRIGLGEAVRDAARQNNAPASDNKRPRKLLIAEDTAAVQDVLKRQLSKLGVEADFVDNGLQALEKLKTEEYGILFTDLHMPEIDGYEVVKRLRAMEEQQGIKNKADGFPIVVLTADVQMAQKQAYLSYGFNECLLKPVSLGQFKQLLVRWNILTEGDKPTVKPRATEAEAKEGVEDNDASRETVYITDSPAEIDLADPATAHVNQIRDNGEDTPPAIDPKAIEEVMGGLDANTIEMLNKFVQMTEPQIDALEDAYKAKDHKKIINVAHSLKGAARSACCLRLGDLADQIQLSAEEGEAPPEHLLDELIMEFSRVAREVAQL